MPSENYNKAVAILSTSPFSFLGTHTTWKKGAPPKLLKSPSLAGSFNTYLKTTFPSMAKHVRSALTAIVDNETRFKKVRESGFPLTQTERDNLIDYLYYTVKYCDGKWASSLGNRSSGSRKDTTMESDGVRFRGTWWIQLTGRTMFSRIGNKALAFRKATASSRPDLHNVFQSCNDVTAASSLTVDYMSVDPEMNVIVTLLYISGNSWYKITSLEGAIAAANKRSIKDILSGIGYDDNGKKTVNVPSLTEMISRANAVQSADEGLINTGTQPVLSSSPVGRILKKTIIKDNNIHDTEKSNVGRRKGADAPQNSRKFQFIRGHRNK